VTAGVRALGLLAVASATALAACSGCNSKTTATVDAGPAIASAAPSTSASVVAPLFPKVDPPFPSDAGAGGGWEGMIRLGLTSSSHKEEIPITLFIRGDRVRYGSPTNWHGLESIALVDVGLRRLVIYSQERDKLFTRIDLPAPETDGGAFPLVATGKKLTLMGLECEVYEQKRGKASSTACIHEGIAFVDPGMSATGVTPPAWMRSLALTKRFVLRALEIDDTGAEALRLEPKGVTVGPPRISLDVPPGYTELKGKMPGSPYRPGLPE
jgi:hypothetical protein